MGQGIPKLPVKMRRLSAYRSFAYASSVIRNYRVAVVSPGVCKEIVVDSPTHLGPLIFCFGFELLDEA